MNYKDKVLFLNSSSFKIKSALPTEDENIDSINIEGFANTTEKDSDGDVIPASVWEAGIARFLENPVVLGFHNHDEPIGKVIEHEVSDKGLWVKARISAASGKIFNLIKDGVVSAFSVGFRIVDAEFKGDTFFITELDLVEISVVSVGANRSALFDLSKSFDSAESFQDFKQHFAKEDINSAKEQDTVSLSEQPTEKGIFEMDSTELKALLNEAAVAAAKGVVDAQAADTAAKAIELEADAAIEARIAAAVAKATVVSGDTGAEKLYKDLEAKFAESEVTGKAALDGLHAELAEKAEELAAMTKSKMTFSAAGSKDATSDEKETAYLISKITGKSIDKTAFGGKLIEKFGTHLPSATWELEVSRNLEQEIRNKLVVAPTMRQLAMQTNVMTIPVNAEAVNASWMANSAFGTTASSGNNTANVLKEVNLAAFKVAKTELLPFEEEEDSLLALLPILRDSMIRGIRRSVDIAFVRGAGAGADPVKGLTLYDAAASTTVSVSTAFALSDLIAMRADLGDWGLDPSNLVYVVSSDVYYDLLKDTQFQTVDKIGDKATFITGQIGSFAGSPVLVSDSFEAKAATVTGAFAFAPSNFIVGNQRGLRFDTESQALEQRNVLVASLRTGLTQISTANGAGISKMDWAI